MNGVRYVSMLHSKLPTAMKDLKVSICMKDTVPWHNSKILKNGFIKKKIELVDFDKCENYLH